MQRREPDRDPPTEGLDIDPGLLVPRDPSVDGDPEPVDTEPINTDEVESGVVQPGDETAEPVTIGAVEDTIVEEEEDAEEDGSDAVNTEPINSDSFECGVVQPSDQDDADGQDDDRPIDTDSFE